MSIGNISTIVQAETEIGLKVPEAANNLSNLFQPFIRVAGRGLESLAENQGLLAIALGIAGFAAGCFFEQRTRHHDELHHGGQNGNVILGCTLIGLASGVVVFLAPGLLPAGFNLPVLALGVGLGLGANLSHTQN